jgi:hypothetical protein
MIEAARRHGHFDPRWHTNGLIPRDREDDHPPMNRPTGNVNARDSHDVPRFPRRRHELIPAVVGEGGTAIHSWENEGGSYSMTDEPDLEADGCEKPPAGLEWYAFLSRYFPGRRRHDLEALKAYETYRSAVASNSFTAAGRVPIASVP